MILIAIACAYVAFLIAFNFANSFKACIIVGVVTFILTFAFLHFNLFVPLCIEMGLLTLGIISALINKNLK